MSANCYSKYFDNNDNLINCQRFLSQFTCAYKGCLQIQVALFFVFCLQNFIEALNICNKSPLLDSEFENLYRLSQENCRQIIESLNYLKNRKNKVMTKNCLETKRIKLFIKTI